MIDVVLPASDNAKLTMPVRLLRESKMINNMIGDIGDQKEIEVHNVKAQLLELTGRFVERMLANAPPVDAPAPAQQPALEFKTWEQAFIDEHLAGDRAVIFDLLLAANFLDVAPLLNLCCRLVASQLKGKTPEQIRVEFNIKNDFTPEEEAQVRAENQWLEDA